MKIQNLAIVFIVIALPILLVLSEYIETQSKAMATKTKYDTALLNTAFDTLAAYEINSRNLSNSEAIGKQIRELEAAVSTFSTSLGNNMGISGASKDYVLSRIPLVVFCMYDGYYIYMPNNDKSDSETLLKPYVYYTRTYKNDKANITIAYSLDNYVSIYGTYDGKNISEAGYLVIPTDVEISGDFSYVDRKDSRERTNLYKVINGKIKYKGLEIEKETIYENKDNENGTIQKNSKDETWDAIMYYYDALNFTTTYNKIIHDAFGNDTEIFEKLYIDANNDPESETSNFRDERVSVIKESLMSNINVGIYNYELSGGVIREDIETPEISEVDWEKILNNVSIIAFMKDIPLNNMTTYNNYVVINSTLTNQYVSAEAIDFLVYKDSSTGNTTGYYHNIACTDLYSELDSNDDYNIVGYPSKDFEKFKYAINNNTDVSYYFKHDEYSAYECKIESSPKINVSIISQYLNNVENGTLSTNIKNKISKSYYTAIARIRYRSAKASSYISDTDTEKTFTVKYHRNGGTWGLNNNDSFVKQTGYNIKNSTDGYTFDSKMTSGEKIGKIYVYYNPSNNPNMTNKEFIGWSFESNIDLNGNIEDLYKNNTLLKGGEILYAIDGKEINLYAQYVETRDLTLNYPAGSYNGRK